MRETKKLSEIRTDGGTQARAGLDEAKVAEYQERIEAGDRLPAMDVVYDGTNYWLWDGFHRHAAALRANRTTYLVDVRQGTRRDAVRLACGANAKHGLPRTDSDKRRAVVTMLEDEEWGEWSDRKIAGECVVSPTFVGKVRASLTVHVDSEPVQERTYTPRHGTTATMNTANIGRAGDPGPMKRAIEANVGAAAYADVRSLQTAVLAYYKPFSRPDAITLLEHLKADARNPAWSGLSLHLASKGKVFRVNDLRQAVNNALDTLKQMQTEAEKQPALSQPSEPAQEKDLLDKRNTLEARLLDALHLRQESAGWWQERRQDGMTDEEIKEAISREWGLGHGSSGPGLVYMNCKGGSDPKFWHNAGVIDKPTLRGAALITKVREVLQMPYPQPASEPAPVPAPVLNGEQEPEPTPAPVADDAPELTPADEIARAMSALHFETRKYIRRNLVIQSKDHEQSADKIAATPTMSSLMPRDDGKFSDYEMHLEAAAFYRLLADLLPI